jgi:5-dehydro-2-deoxygluconokinase
VLLGLEAPEAELARGFDTAAGEPLVRGFAVGRTIFNAAAEGWLAGRITDEQAVAEMARRFAGLVEVWDGVQRRRAS